MAEKHGRRLMSSRMRSHQCHDPLVTSLMPFLSLSGLDRRMLEAIWYARIATVFILERVAGTKAPSTTYCAAQHFSALADVTKSGKLNFEEFCVAMYLLRAYRGGVPLPAVLPLQLIPPSRRTVRGGARRLGVD